MIPNQLNDENLEMHWTKLGRSIPEKQYLFQLNNEGYDVSIFENAECLSKMKYLKKAIDAGYDISNIVKTELPNMTWIALVNATKGFGYSKLVPCNDNYKFIYGAHHEIITTDLKNSLVEIQHHLATVNRDKN